MIRKSGSTVTKAAAVLPSASRATAHTLLNCLIREVAGPEYQTAVVDGRLVLRLPRRGALLSVALRRTSLLGSHRFTGPVHEMEAHGGWAELGWERLAELIDGELALRTGLRNDEFVAQVRSSHDGIAAGLAAPPRATTDRYRESEQSLLLGHRFHPSPKARTGGSAAWSRYSPETGASFPLRNLAVCENLVAQELAEPGADAALERLAPEDVPSGYRYLPAHPWQWEMVGARDDVRAALARGDVLDLGPGERHVWPTASVRTVYDNETFLKFSLDVRITNCLRKNAAYELAGAVALSRRLAPVSADLAARFPGAEMLLEPAYRSIALAGNTAVLEGLGVIVREGLQRVRPGSTPLLAAAVADEHAFSSAHISRLLHGAGPALTLTWWSAYLRLLVPPVLAAYLDHGVVLEPHLQNVVVCVDHDGMPTQILFRDLEGTKLLPTHADNIPFLAGLPADVAAPMTYDPQRAWDRVVYCLIVNHVAEMLAALADLHPRLEATLWRQVRTTLEEHGRAHGFPPPLRSLLAGVPLPAKTNLLTRWERLADRDAGYVRLASPLTENFLAGATEQQQ